MLQVALARNPVLDVIHGSWSRRPVGDNDLRVENHVSKTMYTVVYLYRTRVISGLSHCSKCVEACFK
jgi:hypothetical protein